MTATTFNPFTYFEELKAAGVSEQQAKVQADTLNKIVEGDLATKSDILLLQKDILSVRNELQNNIKELEYKLTIRIGGMFATSIAILGVLIKFGH